NFRIAAKGIRLADSPFRVLTAAEPWPRRAGGPRRAAVSGFGFGGINAHVLLEEHQPGARAASVSVPALPAEPIAIVGVAGRFGPWASTSDVRTRLLGGGASIS